MSMIELSGTDLKWFDMDGWIYKRNEWKGHVHVIARLVDEPGNWCDVEELPAKVYDFIAEYWPDVSLKNVYRYPEED